MTDAELKAFIDGNAGRIAKCVSGDMGGLVNDLQADPSWPQESPVYMLGYVGIGRANVLGATNAITLMGVLLSMQASNDISVKAMGRYFDLALSSASGVNWNDPQVAVLAVQLNQDGAITNELRDAILGSQTTVSVAVDMPQLERVVAQVKQEQQ